MDRRSFSSYSSQLSSQFAAYPPLYSSSSSLSIKNLKKLKDFHLQSIDSTKNQFDIFSKIYNIYDSVFIFESLTGPRELAETSIIGFDPSFLIQCNTQNFMIVDNRKRKIIKKIKVTEPLEQLRSIIPKITKSQKSEKIKNYRYIGGAVGYVSYDAIRFWEKLPKPKKKILNFPLLEFGIFPDGILYDHLEKQAYYFSTGDQRQSRIDQINKIISDRKNIDKYKEDKDIKNSEQFVKCSIPKRNISKREFIRMVKKAQRYIYDGDIFQVVLSKNFKFEIEGNLLNVYSRLRDINPSPYMYLFKINKRCIIGSSPEMLLRVTGDIIETFPIAGTRPVIRDDEVANKKLAEDLLKDEKELAEHTMLVDLARNDVGRVSTFGTVKVKSLMRIKKFSHVQHIVSHVIGKLDKKYDAFDALKAVFPAGTVSGAPKIRAMEIINELEPERREPYAGALGYFSFNGSCDFAITIRSIFVNGKKGYVQSGAGIVMDSIPENEWDETERKADAMISVLRSINYQKRYIQHKTHRKDEIKQEGSSSKKSGYGENQFGA
jgi:anthranilate synthase component 1